jgi:hypothetical protein
MLCCNAKARQHRLEKEPYLQILHKVLLSDTVREINGKDARRCDREVFIVIR